jgi:hypothetical protein
MHQDGSLRRTRNTVILVEGSQLHLVVGPYLLAYSLDDLFSDDGQRYTLIEG